MKEVRALQLSEEEIELINRALRFIYNTKIELVNNNRRILEDDEEQSLTDSAVAYSDLSDDIIDGKKDLKI